MRKLKIFISPILTMSGPIIIERYDLSSRFHGPFILPRDSHLVLVDVIAQMNNKVNVVLASSISISIKVPKRPIRA